MKQSASPKSKTNLSQLAERPINENIVFGIDVGIASCGWAVIDTKDEAILAMGSRCFEAPEDPQKKTLYNEQRRTKRGMRRVTSRRAGRMNSVRQVIKDAGLVQTPTHEYFQSLGKNAPDPWETRALAVEEAITPEEAATALIHIAKHRGFKSSSKRDAAESEGKVVLNAVSEWDKKLDGRTFGKAVYEDYRDGRKRNREGDYQFTASRIHTLEEASQIIQTQRARGAEWATEEFEERYINVAFHQRPLQSSEDLVGKCPFEPDEKRAAKFSYSFERFRMLQTMVNRCRISTPDGDEPLTSGQLKRVIAGFGRSKTLSYTRLRSLIDLPEAKFVGVPDNDASKLRKDITGNTNGACPGSYTLFQLLGTSTWNQLIKTPEILDQIAAIITFNESPDEIRRRFDNLELDAETVETLMEGVNEGKFASFKGTGNVSAKAARKLIPELLRGKTYNIACDEVGYDFNNQIDTNIQDIKNPVVQRALTQAIKQVQVLVRRYGRPGKIHTELLRDVGRSAEERGKMEHGIQKRSDEKQKHREKFKELINAEDCTHDDVEKYELLKEQQFNCAYCERALRPNDIVKSRVQVDHIYPRSRSHENGFENKVATCISCNQSKRNLTPWEWKGEHDPRWWQVFEARVKGFNCRHKEKKRRLLRKSFKDRQQDFIARNKVDSSYVSRALLRELRKLYPESYHGVPVYEGSSRRIFPRHIYPRPGQFTAMLRRAWLSGKYEKDRDDDRHHAMDALIVATLSERLLRKLRDEYKRLELLGRQHKTTPTINPLWESFAQDAIDAYNAGWLVCRTENRRARGALHEETIRSSRIHEDGKQVFYERKAIENITKSDVSRIPDPVIRERVASWLEDGKSNDNRPYSAKGDPIRKLRLRDDRTKTAIQINRRDMGGKNQNRQGGFAKNSEMLRVDVFKVTKDREDSYGNPVKAGYYLVPVYARQAMLQAAEERKRRNAIKKGRTVGNRRHTTPLNAVKREGEWPEMDCGEFVTSLYPFSYVELTKRDGSIVKGYYRTTNSFDAGIVVSPHKHSSQSQKIGSITLRSIRKFQIDRLGCKKPLKAETWPGHQYDH